MTAVGVGCPWVTAGIIFECFDPEKDGGWLVIMKGAGAGDGAGVNMRGDSVFDVKTSGPWVMLAAATVATTPGGMCFGVIVSPAPFGEQLLGAE